MAGERSPLFLKKMAVTVAMSLMAVFVLSCNSKREEPVLGKVTGADARSGDYRKSYFFDKKVSDLSLKITRWNQVLTHLVESQGLGEKQPILVNSIELILPVLKESQRGFFRKVGNSWQKDVSRVEKLSVDKDIVLEKIKIILSDNNGLAEKDASWALTASGRYPKDQEGDLFKLKWDSIGQELHVESQQNTDNKVSCHFSLNKSSGEIEKSLCEHFVIFRVENRDIIIDHLTYDRKKGFNGDGKVMLPKGQQEKWELHSVAVNPLMLSAGGQN